jgi:hypothetical protein
MEACSLFQAAVDKKNAVYETIVGAFYRWKMQAF